MISYPIFLILSLSFHNHPSNDRSNPAPSLPCPPRGSPAANDAARKQQDLCLSWAKRCKEHAEQKSKPPCPYAVTPMVGTRKTRIFHHGLAIVTSWRDTWKIRAIYPKETSIRVNLGIGMCNVWIIHDYPHYPLAIKRSRTSPFPIGKESTKG